MSVEDKVKKIIAEKLSVDLEEVVEEASFVDDLGADSLDLVELIMSMEEEFDIDISDEDAEKLVTVKDAIDYINANYTPVRVNIEKEVKIASRFQVYTIPDLRFLTPEGDSIARWPGYLESDRLLVLLRFISTDSYKNMGFSDFVKGQKQE